MAYKRSIHADTNEFSEIAFLLFGTEGDAYRGFCALGGVEIEGRVVRVNYVNGVRFEVDEEE